MDVTRRVTMRVLLLPGLAVLLFAFLYPVALTLAAPPDGDPATVARETGTLLSDPHLLPVIARSIRVAVMTTLICLLLGFPTAYLVSRAPARWSGKLLALAIFPLMLNTVVRTYGWIAVLGGNGVLSTASQALGLGRVQLLYTETAIVLGLVQLFLPLMILSSYSSLSQQDPRLEDAARGLGAGPGRVFRQVVFPLALPGALVGCTLVFAGSITAFTTPQLLGGSRERILSTLLYSRVNVSLDWPSASAVALVMTVLVLAVAALSGRLSKRGSTTS
ncbi:putative spermidine/putrescine transport system permease protein [Spinactinospora alkalitolerans]|uniref:Putative spermidine/putrescine transport system permease protein n=1 Tax=Spinactinospora alkalitolerans TaxID=687207 RepID=A0A852TTF4_9ACTN|nr:ABC transporter permease [Spinactinospora alkalitolerans]NYE46033.1 putative spermidine/putrescine transport system permease protein [Spinactinospora alkalitolerans]